jgi:hypothetical protein
MVGLALCNPSASAAGYVYADVTDFASSIMLDTDTKEGAVGDRGTRVELCAEKDAFKCFEMEGMVFAIPRKFDERRDQAEWEFRGHTFRASRAHGITILGAKYDVFFIDSLSQNAPIRFWYSPRAGLIGIKGLRPRQDRVFLLQSKCGFASSSHCR